MASSPSEHEIQQRIRQACGRDVVRLWRAEKPPAISGLWSFTGLHRGDWVEVAVVFHVLLLQVLEGVAVVLDGQPT